MNKNGIVRAPAGLLRRNISWTFWGNVAYAAGQWLLLILIARLGTAEEVGHFALGLAITAPIFMLSDLQLKAVQATDSENRYKFRHFLALRVVTTTAAVMFTIVLLKVLGYKGEVGGVILSITLLRAVESISDVYYGVFHRSEKMDLAAQSYMLRSVGILLISGGIYVISRTLWLSVTGGVVVAVLILILFDMRKGGSVLVALEGYPRADRVVPEFNRRKMFRLAKISLPLGVAVALVSLNSNVSRYYVEYWNGTEALGYFGALAYLGVGASRISSAVTQSLRPRLANVLRTNMASFTGLVNRTLSIFIAASAIGVVFAAAKGGWLLTIIYGDEYGQFGVALTWIAVALLFQWIAGVVSVALQAAHDYRSTAVAASVELATAVILGYLLVASYGVSGAGATVAISSFSRACSLVYRYMAWRREIRAQ